ncbi:MAG: hypothetical protein JXA95_19205, partial [Spirochaetales bacterium]|nr:hypothetical protein [Spirochaetales bacterium]
TIPSAFGFRTESRGLGSAEMAWSLKKGRNHRANKEMAYHALEVLHGLRISGEKKSYYQLESTFEQTSPLPKGYLLYENFMSLEESALAD